MSNLRVLLAIPTAGVAPMAFTSSLVALIAHVAARGVPTLPGAEVYVSMQVVESANWMGNREELVESALALDHTHLMFLDDDMSFEPQILEIMLGRRRPIVAANYLIKTPDWRTNPQWVAVGLDGERVPVTAAASGLQEVAHTGFGASLFEIDVFRKVPGPRFLPDYSPQTRKYTTEDSPFYRKAREAGFPVLVDHDASRLVKHIGRAVWGWEGVEERNG